MLKSVPDPRRCAPSDDSLLARLANRFAAASPASQQGVAVALREEIARLLRENAELNVRNALHHPQSAAAARAIWSSLDAVLLPRTDSRVQLRTFAIPILIVAGGQAGSVIPAVVPDAHAITALFTESGAVGQSRNFGLSNALASHEALYALSWTRLLRLASGVGDGDRTPLDLPPAEIRLESDEESVHLRYLTGVAIAPADAPGLPETAADIGRWGMAFTKTLAAQIGAPGSTVLPIPRMPMSILGALRCGRFSANEIGFQLFLSNALRQERLRSGDPDVTVAAYSDATIRIRLTSSLDDALDRDYRWALTAIDDLDEIMDSIYGLLAEARLERVEVVDTIETAETTN